MAEQATKERVTRKTEPNIKVAEALGRKPIDQLLADNPDDSFVRVPLGSSKATLAERGLEIVEQSDGTAITRKGYQVARKVTSKIDDEIQADHDLQEEMMESVRDVEKSKDKTSVKKTPNARKKKSSKKD